MRLSVTAIPPFPCHAVTPTMHPMTLSSTVRHNNSRAGEVQPLWFCPCFWGQQALFFFFGRTVQTLFFFLGGGQKCQGAESQGKYLSLFLTRALSWGPCLSADSAVRFSNEKVFLYKDKHNTAVLLLTSL